MQWVETRAPSSAGIPILIGLWAVGRSSALALGHDRQALAAVGGGTDLGL